MNTNLQINDYESESEIRSPDETQTHQLIDDSINFNNNFNNNNFNNNNNDDYIINDYDLEMAISESIKEEEEYQKNQLKILEKIQIRIKEFDKILLYIKRISMIDNEILDFYNIIQPIIDCYCGCNIENYKCDEVMYNKIFNILKTIRISESELELFKKVFVRE